MLRRAAPKARGEAGATLDQALEGTGEPPDSRSDSLGPLSRTRWPDPCSDSRPGTRGRNSQKRAARPPNGEAREPGPRLSGRSRLSEPPHGCPELCGRPSPPAWASECPRSQRAQCPPVGCPDPAASAPRWGNQGAASLGLQRRRPRRARPQAAGGQGVKMARREWREGLRLNKKPHACLFFFLLFLKSHFWKTENLQFTGGFVILLRPYPDSYPQGDKKATRKSNPGRELWFPQALPKTLWFPWNSSSFSDTLTVSLH